MSGNFLPAICRCFAGRAASSTNQHAKKHHHRSDHLLDLVITFYFSKHVVIITQPLTMAPALTDSAKIEEAKRLGKTDPSKAEAIYKEILSKKPAANEGALREYESALMGLGESYRDTRKTDELAELVRSSTSSLSSFTKAKTAKLGIELRSIQHAI